MLKVEGVEELEAVVLLFKRAPAEIKRGIRQESRAWAPSIVAAAKSMARGPVERRIAASGKVTVTDRGPVARFGSSGRLRPGVPLARIARHYEFGTNRRNMKTKYLGRNRYTRDAQFITRRTRRQLPQRNATGRFVYPALAEETPALVARYVRVIAKAVTYE